MTDHIAAFRRERDAVLDFCSRLTPAEWVAPSRAAGWRVRDVIAHLGSECRLNFGPDVVKVMRSRNIERLNDDFVARRADWEIDRVVGELATWSSRIATAARATQPWPLGSIRLPIGELGAHPLRLLPSLLTFDFHTHLRHDIAPALDKDIPATDPDRMSSILEWMLALLANFGANDRIWFDRPIGLTLTGPGGGTWRLEPIGHGRLRAVVGSDAGMAAQITSAAIDFPSWGTTRTPWRSHGVAVTGDAELAERFLDSIDLV
ncbi:maleylpyruvate isomerase N-terminal domain-containing protein [Nocardia sp. NPDC004604]|uniref:maleylpyruvate isomerase N-terminal domain-containing protein n=1 Tax=Nocardia sp. NPDC004604 TaxID=3157013 RepID=UPI0033BE0C1B